MFICIKIRSEAKKYCAERLGNTVKQSLIVLKHFAKHSLQKQSAPISQIPMVVDHLFKPDSKKNCTYKQGAARTAKKRKQTKTSQIAPTLMP